MAEVGVTTDTGHLVLIHKGKTVCDIPIAPLGDDAPNLNRPYDPPKNLDILYNDQIMDPVTRGTSYNDVVSTLITSPDIASKRWIWEQYDRSVMGDTVDCSNSGGDAAIVRIHGTNKAVAITTDCTPRYVTADAFEGGKQAVAETYRNLCSVGAEPIAITDCLNFGNPERKEVMGQFVRAIEGIDAACRALDYPVVSGDVSLYNETNGQAIPPTPAIGGVGLIKDLERYATLKGAKEGEHLVLLGKTDGWLGASLYAQLILGHEKSDTAMYAPPPVDLEAEKAAGTYVRRLIRDRRVSSVHDLSDGGLALAAIEMAFASGIGFALKGSADVPLYAWLFGEDQGRYLVSV